MVPVKTISLTQCIESTFGGDEIGQTAKLISAVFGFRYWGARLWRDVRDTSTLPGNKANSLKTENKERDLSTCNSFTSSMRKDIDFLQRWKEKRRRRGSA